MFLSDKGNGIGRMMMNHAIREAKSLSFHTIIARIGGENDISINLHKSCGFTLVGTMKEVGFKFNKWCDVHIMQLML